jgi:flagellar hook-length control protein FliK
VSQVASDATAPAFKPAPSIPPRAAPSSDLAPDLPFASLLDDGTQDAAPPPPQTRPAPADRGTDTTADSTADKTADPVASETTDPAASKRPDKAAGKTAHKATGKTADKTTAKIADKTTAKAADSTATAIAAQPNSPELPIDPNGAKTAKTSGETAAAKAPDGSKAVQAALQIVDNNETTNAANAAGVTVAPTKSKVPGNTKVTTDAKLVEDTKTADTTKPADDGKPANDNKQTDTPAPVTLAADLAKNPVQTVAPAVVVAPAPTTAVVNPPAPGRESQTASVAIQAATVAADAPKPKAPDLAPAPGATEKFTDAKDGVDKPTTAKDGTAKFAPEHPRDEDITAAPRASAQTSPSTATDAQATAPKPAGDAVQQAAQTPPSPDVLPLAANPPASTAPTAQAALTPPAAAVPVAGVAIEIASQVQSGKNHFEIRLDPPELGRIEVRLDVDRDGHTTTRLIADRSDTLDLMRRDASGLERALQDAGLKTSDSGLQFSLRDQTMGRQQDNTPALTTAQIVVQDNTLPSNEITQRNYSRLAGLRGGIDIRV